MLQMDRLTNNALSSRMLWLWAIIGTLTLVHNNFRYPHPPLITCNLFEDPAPSPLLYCVLEEQPIKCPYS